MFQWCLTGCFYFCELVAFFHLDVVTLEINLTCIFKLCQYNINVALLNIEINCKMLLNLFLLSCVLWVFYQVINRSYRSEFILTCPDYPDTTDLCTLFVSLGACISVRHITPKGLIRILTYLRNKITSVMAS